MKKISFKMKVFNYFLNNVCLLTYTMQFVSLLFSHKSQVQKLFPCLGVFKLGISVMIYRGFFKYYVILRVSWLAHLTCFIKYA